MAEHYGTAVIPARVRKPKDKPSVEGAVGVISTWIIAALRNWRFFTLRELNEAIFEKLGEFNSRPFQNASSWDKTPQLTALQLTAGFIGPKCSHLCE
jgi:hypothetical protein